MHDALIRVECLLRAYGHVYQANLAAIAVQTFDRDPHHACRLVNSDEWWSGLDSVAAIDLAVDGGFTATARQDALALRRALVEVFTTLRAYGEHNDAGELVVSQFSKWIESHV